MPVGNPDLEIVLVGLERGEIMTKAVKEAAEKLCELEEIAGRAMPMCVYLDDQVVQLIRWPDTENRFRLKAVEIGRHIPGWYDVPLEKLGGRKVDLISQPNDKTNGNKIN